jgi:hypothetical protein
VGLRQAVSFSRRARANEGKELQMEERNYKYRKGILAASRIPAAGGRAAGASAARKLDGCDASGLHGRRVEAENPLAPSAALDADALGQGLTVLGCRDHVLADGQAGI